MKIKTSRAIVFVLLVVVGALGGWVLCRLSALRSPNIPASSLGSEKLRWVQDSDVVADFRQHVVREHDTRSLSRYGLSFTSEFFGLTETPEMQRLIQKYGSRRLEAGDDIITSAEQMQDQIGIYGTRYNGMLLGYLQCQQ